MIEEISNHTFNIASITPKKQYWNQDNIRFFEYWEYKGHYYFVVYFGKFDSVEYYRTDDPDVFEIMFDNDLYDIILMQQRQQKLELI
jgi:hypothetical protein